MRLVITEKPSVARDLARVLGARRRGDGFLEGEGLRITWCVGHLLEFQDPAGYDPRWKRWRFEDLPMVPERFALRPRRSARERWAVVRAQLRSRDVREVVNACDAGREGELIFRFVYEASGCDKPVLRLWTSSLTDEALRSAWAGLREGRDFDPLADAARCRAEADWLVGLNATRAMTCLARRAGGDGLLSVGRVQTPTLAMIVARDREIAAFVPETFFQVRATFTQGEASWVGTWFRPTDGERPGPGDDEREACERVADRAVAEAIAAAARGEGRVRTASSRRRTERPPLLYDLTALQRRANQRYGLSADRTLALAQALYERHKVITYPRTDARFLTPDQVATLPAIVDAVGRLGPYAPHAEAVRRRGIRPGRRVVDASEVGDHHAILPTDRTPDPSALSADEKRIYDLVARRLLAVLSADAVFELTEIVVEVPPQGPLPDGISGPLTFRSRGRVLVEPGWRAVDPPGRDRERVLPAVAAGGSARVTDAAVKEGQTRPPPPFSDASILKAMETAGRDLDDEALKRAMRSAGLGTPATRAAILQTLVARGYVVREGKHLRSTERGRALIDAVPVDDLLSAELTGRWEKRLADIAEGREARDRFMADATRWLHEVIRAIEAADPPPAAAVQRPETPVLGRCPVCGTPVREGRGAYVCETGRACRFVVFKKMSRRTISPRLVKVLLEKGRTRAVKGFRNKAGRPFSAGLKLEDDGTVGFWFPERGERSTKAADPVGMACPRCGDGRIVRGRAAWGCDRYRDGCRFVIAFEEGGRPVTPAEAVARLRREAGRGR